MNQYLDRLSVPSDESYKTIRGRRVTFRRGHKMFMGEHSYPWSAFCGGECIAYDCATKAECEKEARVFLRQQAEE